MKQTEQKVQMVEAAYELNRAFTVQTRKLLSDLDAAAEQIAPAYVALEEKRPLSYPQHAIRAQHLALAEFCARLNRALSDAAGDMSLPHEERKHLNSALEHLVDQASGIEVLQRDGVLGVKMPNPPSRNATYKNHIAYLPTLQKALVAQREKDGLLPSTCNTFFFWHIMPRNAPAAYADNDNYLVKSIVDTICDVYALSDSGDCAFFFHASALTDELPSALYLLVAPQEAQFTCFCAAGNVIRFFRIRDTDSMS